MPIVASNIVEDRKQTDGRRAVRERHVDHLGREYFVDYLAESQASLATAMTARVPQIEASLANQECDSNLAAIENTGSGTLSTQHSTTAQNLSQIRQRFREATGLTACRMAKWLLTLTNAQLNAMFGTNGATVVALRQRLQDRATAGDTAISKAGE